MKNKNLHVDKFFLTIVGILVLVGFFIFLSASLGLLAREGTIFSRVAGKQLFYGIFLGLPALFIASRVSYDKWKKLALPLFAFSLLLLLLTFVPHIGVTTKGASRWISIFGLSFQPVELVKVGIVLYLSLWYSNIKGKIKDMRYGMGSLLCIICIPAVLLAFQPDNGSVILLIATSVSIYLVASGRWKHLLIVALLLLVTISIVASTRPYVQSRIKTFLDPSLDPQGAGYQMRQATIAIGSGEIIGRGFGQSVQKFNYLPEPVSDSIFAVFAEEFGFVGSVMLIFLFVAFTLRGLWLGARAPDTFGSLVTVGLTIMISSQSFLNIGAMLGLVPLSGLPLIFVSQGGTALVFALFSVGIILGISRHRVTLP